MGKQLLRPGFKVGDNELTKENYMSILKMAIGGQLVNEASGELAGKFSAPSYVKAVSGMEKASEKFFTPLYEDYFKANQNLTMNIYDKMVVLSEVFSGRDIVEISKIVDLMHAIHLEKDTIEATIHRIFKKNKITRGFRKDE